jgi:hypothetical protein
VIVLANHVSDQYAKPLNDTLYREDFRNSTSNEWNTTFSISTVGLPNGMVNRMEPFAKGISSWSTFIPVALRKAQQAKLDVTTSYDVSQKLLNVKVKTTFLEDLSINTRLVMVLTQDSIIGQQKDYSPPSNVELNEPGGDIRMKYKFDHLVIGAINGTWGEVIKTAPVQKNDTVTVFSECNLLSRCFYKDVVCINDRHISLVVFLYNSDSKEIIQAEKVKIR